MKIKDLEVMVWQYYSVFLYFPFKNKKEILLKENLF